MWATVQETDPICYLDATGNIIQKVTQQTAPFLYSLVFHDKGKKFIFPVAEFISTGHDSQTISAYLTLIKIELQRTIPKSFSFKIAPIIVTDFCWGQINAVMSVFNNCEADVYVNWCFEILLRKKTSTIFLNVMKVILHICSAHFIKLIIKKVRKIKKFKDEKKDQKLQNAFIFNFSLLQNAVTVEEFKMNLKHTFNIFNIKYFSKKCVYSGGEVKRQLLERNLTVININEDEPIYKLNEKMGKQKIVLVDNDFSENSLKQTSPFGIYYRKVVENHSKNIKTHLTLNCIDELNEYYSPELFNVILDYIHLLPFWSGIMIGHWSLLNPKYKSMSRLTNNSVENWFNQVKTYLIPHRPTMPSVFTSRIHQRIESEFEQRYKNECVQLNNSNHSSKEKEKWRKNQSFKRKRGFFYGAPGRNVFENFKMNALTANFNAKSILPEGTKI